MMKHLFLFLTISILMFGCNSKPEKENWKVIPRPNNIKVTPGSFSFKNAISLKYSDKSLEQTAALFERKIKKEGIDTDTNAESIIELALTRPETGSGESYKLDVNPEKISVTAESPQGIFYGLMTILQNIRLSKNKTVPCGTVTDTPRYRYRGFMLDESRHFFGKEKVEQIIDLMSELKLNSFHWHLTDEPGWRIEIKAYPKLATIGGMGNYNDPDASAKYYTQDEIKEIVDYAAGRFVTIIPEIDMPGHATAANRAYPEFSGGGSKKHPDFTFNPGKEGTYAYLTTILREVAGLFPSQFIHLGGDEVHYGNGQWATNPDVKALMKREKLKTLTDVEHYFIRRMSDSIASLGRKTAGWDEIITSGADKERLLIYWWRHDKPEWLDKALDNSYKTVLCPRIPLYFDFIQDTSHKNGRTWGGKFCTLSSVYHFPDSLRTFSPEEKTLINGIQGNLWTERYKTGRQIDFMTYPRLPALSETAWTEKNNKDFERFKTLLPEWFNYLKSKNIYYFNILNKQETPEPK